MYRNKKKYLDKLFYWDVLIVSKKQQQKKNDYGTLEHLKMLVYLPFLR